jgi:predicted PurR-regulated permease PerM
MMDYPAMTDDPAAPRRISLPRLATIAGVAAVLFLAQEVFLPLAIAMLITFALSPLVSALRKRGVPVIAAVLGVVFVAFAMIALLGLIMVGQIGELAQNLPEFQANILAKVEALKSSGGEHGIAARLSDMITAVNAEIGSALPGDSADKPMQVEVVERTNAWAVLLNLVLPLISPVATTGLVVVVVIFMLLEREQLRERFIRLVGAHDIHRTTQLLQDAGSRVATYLLIQLLVNVIYAIPIGVGLWLIGIPNAVLWGLLTLILRFVPYIGSVLSAAFPLFLAVAVSPDWTALLWTGALFVAVELITSNVVEPWLYGSRTGLSPLAIIVAAIFWTFLWGPLGLVLSTPLTVCLVVLGRHLPQFELFDILLGDEPVLHPHVRLYQRLLAGDAVEATYQAEEDLEEQALADYYQSTAIPALLQAQDDRDRGVLTVEQEARLAKVVLTVVENLAPVADEERDAPPEEGEADAPGKGVRVVCVGGRWPVDDASAAMLAQSLGVEGAEARWHAHESLAPSRLASLSLDTADCLILCFLDPAPSRASLLHVRRLKRAAPHLRVGVMVWQMPDGVLTGLDQTGAYANIRQEKIDEIQSIGADFAVTALDAGLEAAFIKEVPRKVAAAARPPNRAAVRRRTKAAS